MSYWIGTKIPKSTGNGFDLSMPRQIDWGVFYAAAKYAASKSEKARRQRELNPMPGDLLIERKPPKVPRTRQSV